MNQPLQIFWKKEDKTYKFSGSAGAMDDQVSHITNEVSLQSQNKEEVTDDK